MGTISRTGITGGGTIQPSHITNIIDALDGTSNNDIIIKGKIATGTGTSAIAINSHAEGLATTTNGIGSHAEGNTTTATGNYSHAEADNTTATGDYSHAEGSYTQANGYASHAEGDTTIASGSASHAEGRVTQALGDYSHAEGRGTIALASFSHAEGYNTIASGSYQHVQGQYNTHGDTTSLFIVGNGTTPTLRKDAFKVRMSGSIVLPTTQSAAPTWTGTDGEMIFATISGNHRFYVWMSGAWRSGSLA
jgi:hypothetical protein